MEEIGFGVKVRNEAEQPSESERFYQKINGIFTEEIPAVRKDVDSQVATRITNFSKSKDGQTFIKFLREEGEWARKTAAGSIDDERINAFYQGRQDAYIQLAEKLEALRGV